MERVLQGAQQAASKDMLEGAVLGLKGSKQAFGPRAQRLTPFLLSHSHSIMPAFDLNKCSKRKQQESAEGGKSKAPRVGDVVVDALTPRYAPLQATRPTHGPVVLCIYKYTSNLV